MDGPLNPYAAKPHRRPEGYETHRLLTPGWDAAAQAHAAAGAGQTNESAADIYASAGAFDPVAARAAIARLDAPVLFLAGELDSGPRPRVAAAIVKLFPHAELTSQPAAGHYPWLDDPAVFTQTVAAFLARGHTAPSN
ncbi:MULTISPECIES: alpha/beta fold hydrolase [Streptomyces]|uniref:alpha/beta fold hydrolase n=1 Tax=Streptomyces TaxID=1883 RepID=UPI00345C3923